MVKPTIYSVEITVAESIEHYLLLLDASNKPWINYYKYSFQRNLPNFSFSFGSYIEIDHIRMLIF